MNRDGTTDEFDRDREEWEDAQQLVWQALTVERLATLLAECPDLWTAGDTDFDDYSIYQQAAAWLLPRLKP